MAESDHESAFSAADDLFDRYTLPKVALTIILGASLLGTTLSLHLDGTKSLIVILAKWGYLVSLGIIVGGLAWKHMFVRPQDLNTGAGEYCGRMYARFDRIQKGATVVLAATGGVVIARYWHELTGPLHPGAVTVCWIALLGVLVVSARSSQAVTIQFRSVLGVGAFVLGVSLLIATAVTEVGLRGGTVALAAVRSLHLVAFAVWVGGAVWNIFVAVPTGQESPTIAVVSAAGQQLERFRWAVRFIIPTLLLTGLYQAVSAFGVSYAAYLQSVLGLAVVAKFGLVAVLVVIFKLCPMWRACSPIEGVCDLNELGSEEQPETVEVTNDD